MWITPDRAQRPDPSPNPARRRHARRGGGRVRSRDPRIRPDPDERPRARPSSGRTAPARGIIERRPASGGPPWRGRPTGGGTRRPPPGPSRHGAQPRAYRAAGRIRPGLRLRHHPWLGSACAGPLRSRRAGAACARPATGRRPGGACARPEWAPAPDGTTGTTGATRATGARGAPRGTTGARGAPGVRRRVRTSPHGLGPDPTTGPGAGRIRRATDPETPAHQGSEGRCQVPAARFAEDAASLRVWSSSGTSRSSGRGGRRG